MEQKMSITLAIAVGQIIMDTETTAAALSMFCNMVKIPVYFITLRRPKTVRKRFSKFPTER
jgi:hypothetical protein